MDIFAWAKKELNTLMDFFHEANPFWVYIKTQWLSKTQMSIVDHLNLSYVGQDTNAFIKRFHSNLKATLRASKGKAHGQ
jgi:hypothetical protein